MTLRHIHDTPRPASGLALAHDGLQLKAIDPNGRVLRVRPERGTPVHAVAASVALDPTGANNTVTLTADAVGFAGNSLRAVMTVPTSAEIVATKSGDTVSIAAGSKHRMVVTGTLDPDATGTAVYVGLVGDTKVWTTDGTLTPAAEEGWIRVEIEPGELALIRYYFGGSLEGQWISTETGEWPDGLTFQPDGAETGDATITTAAPTAAQVVAAVNTAALGVTASGAGTGAVAAVTATAFTSGRDATLGSAGDQLFDDTNRYLAATDVGPTSTAGWKTTAL
jgi:hypothetical protein